MIGVDWTAVTAPDEGAARRGVREGFEANATDKAPQKATFDKMLALVPDVKEASTLTFTYLPERGTTLHVGGKDLGVFEGKGSRTRSSRSGWGPRPLPRT